MGERFRQAHLELIRATGANEFDGARVAADLEAHNDLWNAAIVHEDDIGSILLYAAEPPPGAPYAALDVLSSGRDDSALEALANTWRGDSVDWVNDILSPETGRVLRVWWD